MSEATRRFQPAKPDPVNCYRFQRAQTGNLPAAWMDIPKWQWPSLKEQCGLNVEVKWHFEAEGMEEETQFYITRIDIEPAVHPAPAGMFYLWCEELQRRLTCLWIRSDVTWSVS